MGRYKTWRVKKNLVGETINNWLVLDKLPNGKNGRVYWQCKCIKCGIEKKVRDDSVKKNPNGCIICTNKLALGARVPGSRSKLYKGTKDISGVYWKSISRGAKERNLEFSISMQYAQKLIEEQNYSCKLSGSKLKTYGELRSLDAKFATASLDRIDSSRGYIEGNVQWVHKNINVMKFDLEQKEFFDWCEKVFKYQSSLKTIECNLVNNALKVSNPNEVLIA